MSQYMQIDISIRPFFEVPFEKRFPRLADLLRKLGYEDVISKEPSFYYLIDTLMTISEHPETPKNIREQISPFVGKLAALKAEARDYLLARRLDDLDRKLYEIEDQFEDLEGVI